MNNMISNKVWEFAFIESLKAYNDSKHLDTAIETETPKDVSKCLTHKYETKQYNTVESNNSIEAKFHLLFKEYKRQIEEKVLYDVLCRFYFADWTRQCDYEKMTSEEVVNATMTVCKDIEKAWDYNLDGDIMPMCGSISFDFNEDIID